MPTLRARRPAGLQGARWDPLRRPAEQPARAGNPARPVLSSAPPARPFLTGLPRLRRRTTPAHHVRRGADAAEQQVAAGRAGAATGQLSGGAALGPPPGGECDGEGRTPLIINPGL